MPDAGPIYIETTLYFSHICANSAIIPFPPPGPPTPPTPGGGGGQSNTNNSGSRPLIGFLEFSQNNSGPLISQSATDQTQIFNYTNEDQSTLFNQDFDYNYKTSALIKGSRTYAYQFESGEQTRLQAEGVVIASNTAGNRFNLDRGNIVFNPQKNIVVGTHEGDVYIGSGSSVLVMETGHDVIIYNLHDEARARVSVIAANKKLVLEPGRFLVLTRQNTQDFDSLVAPCHNIGYCHIKKTDLSGSIRTFYGDFSIPAALTMVVPLKRMVSSNDAMDKRAIENIIKTSAMLSIFNPQNSPFQNGAMFR
jgi:hypothetical protein